MAVVGLVYLAVIVLDIVSMWMVFQKAGQPGWEAIIPVYNIYLLVKIAGRPGWWWVLLLIPLVNLVIGIMVSIGVARHFDRSDVFGVGLFFLGFIFYPILAFSHSDYHLAALA